MAPLAIAMFVGLFAFGDRLVGFHDMTTQLHVALFAAFLFGIVAGYKSKA